MTVYGPDPPAEPVPVEVGEVFVVHPKLYNPNDPKTERPIVVVHVEASATGDVHIRARTSDTDAEGVPHAADRRLGLERAGTWEPIPYRIWRPLLAEPAVERRGMLGEPYLSEVLRMFREVKW